VVSFAQDLTQRATGRRFGALGAPPWLARWLAVAPVVFLTPVLALMAYWNFAGLLYSIGALPHAGTIGDWFYWGWVDPAHPYAFEWVRWSPPAVAVMGFLHPWALWPVIVAHVAVLAFLRDWRVIAIVLLAWPFWEDALNGGITTFAFVAAWAAIEGSSVGVAAFVLPAVLVPRPLMLPVLAWLAWHRPLARWLIALGAFGVVAVSFATNQLGPWLQRLVEVGAPPTFNLAPSAWIGGWWVLIGLPLAAWLTIRGRLGLASLAASPYLLVYYLGFALLELRNRGANVIWSRATESLVPAWSSRDLRLSLIPRSRPVRLGLALTGLGAMLTLGVMTGLARISAGAFADQPLAIAYCAAAFMLIPALAWVLDQMADSPETRIPVHSDLLVPTTGPSGTRQEPEFALSEGPR